MTEHTVQHPHHATRSARKRSLLSAKTQRWLTVILALIAVFNLSWLGLRALVNHRMKTQYVETTGIIVDVAVQKPDNRSAEHHYPVIEFKTTEGNSVVFKAKVGTPEPAYQPGETVVILYNKEKPYIALLDTTPKR